jgi:Xaa-Pro aminopeptidase
LTQSTTPSPPFDVQRLDALLEEHGLDAVLATSPHNTRYLMGGYRFFLYAVLDGIGMDRYMPVVGYLRERPDQAFYVGAGNEDWGTVVDPPWTPTVANVSWTAAHASEVAAGLMRERGGKRLRIGVELPYLPADALRALELELPQAELKDAGQALEDLRAVKSEQELELMRTGAEAVVDAMLATFGQAEGKTEAEVVELLRIEETRRRLRFGYCLVASGPSANRGPSPRRIGPGEALSLDSGAEHLGYVADLTRMGVAGEPNPRQVELLDQIVEVQRAARETISAGSRGGAIFDAALERIGELPDGDRMTFLAHGTGLLSHEAPRLTETGSPPYPATHRELPLQAGMVLSVETHVIDPEEGFVKLEDTVIVTADGHDPCGDHGRGWNVLGG